MFGVCAFSQIFYPEDQRLSLCITRKIEVRRKKALHSISRKNYVRRQIAFSNYLDLVSHRQKLLQWPLKFERPILYHLYSFNVSKKVFSVWPFDKSSYKSVGAYSTPNLKNHFCIQFGQSSFQKIYFLLECNEVYFTTWWIDFTKYFSSNTKEDQVHFKHCTTLLSS